MKTSFQIVSVTVKTLWGNERSNSGAGKKAGKFWMQNWVKEQKTVVLGKRGER